MEQVLCPTFSPKQPATDVHTINFSLDACVIQYISITSVSYLGMTSFIIERIRDSGVCYEIGSGFSGKFRQISQINFG